LKIFDKEGKPLPFKNSDRCWFP